MEAEVVVNDRMQRRYRYVRTEPAGRGFRRHAAQVRRRRESGDPFCRPKQRQALLQWAYDSRVL